MKKWMYVCAAAMMTVALLSGCSGKAGSSSAQTQTSQTQAGSGQDQTDSSQTQAGDSQNQSGNGQTQAGDSNQSGNSQTQAGDSQNQSGSDQTGTEGTGTKETGTQAESESGTKAENQEGTGDVWITPEELQAAAGKHHVKINIKDYGTISVELDGDHAPLTVANFLKLSREGFYNGLTFHRIMSGFMIQGGDPLGTGMGGSEHQIKGEFSSNGVDNPLSHTRGAISMARSQDMDSASSQFFIVHEDSKFLDGQYACFGYVTDGMDVVDAICKDVKPVDNNGTVPKADQPVIESVEVID